MLLVAAAHGVHGLVVIADDYIVSARGRQIARLLSIVFLLVHDRDRRVRASGQHETLSRSHPRCNCMQELHAGRS